MARRVTKRVDTTVIVRVRCERTPENAYKRFDPETAIFRGKRDRSAEMDVFRFSASCARILCKLHQDCAYKSQNTERNGRFWPQNLGSNLLKAFPGGLFAGAIVGWYFPPAVLILPLSSTRYNRFLSSRGLVRLFMRCYCNLIIHQVCRGMRYSCMFALSCTAVNLYGVSTLPTSQA